MYLARGKVEVYLLEELKRHGKIHITLIDPEKVEADTASKTAAETESLGSSAIMVGGSTLTSPTKLDEIVQSIKKAVSIPVILFPNNITGISRYADAIWFMSLLNSSDPYYIIGAQMLGAPLVKKYGIEPLPMGYIVVGEESAVSVVGQVKAIPRNKPELAAAYALAAQYLGMRFVYLEAGSGARKPVPREMINLTKRFVDIPLIVGGGIKTGDQARAAVEAGADIIVTGTITEDPESKRNLQAIIQSIRLAGGCRG
ncbi:geranylgeranylglyceryl/heptaprenylglyceryl phosphate synthase [Candidatus Bathyarchaeota archaeon]|nr:geranylgeranylglyceryl/heptaprenylglyceryl phosphate synthase [Candidatus Bathyarchaeota archaeon]